MRAFSLIALSALVAGCHGSKNPPPPGSEDVVHTQPAVTDGGVPIPVGDGGVAMGTHPGQVVPAGTPQPRPPRVKIFVHTVPAKIPGKPKQKVKVMWGKKLLGETPLTFDRPRDSGPIDLVIRTDGYFPVHTRVYTMKNERVDVRLTKLDDRMTIFGAKAELPPPATPPDGGAPPTAPPPAPPTPTTVPPG
jgi:hypothetical protein